MTDQEKADKIVYKLMYPLDAFSQWMQIDIINVSPGACEIKAEIRSDMLNGFNVCHGGVTFSLADSAFAFASNSRGVQALSIETSISHSRPVLSGDIITASARELNLSSRLAIYDVVLTNQNNESVAFFKGTVFRTGKQWEV